MQSSLSYTVTTVLNGFRSEHLRQDANESVIEEQKKMPQAELKEIHDSIEFEKMVTSPDLVI